MYVLCWYVYAFTVGYDFPFSGKKCSICFNVNRYFVMKSEFHSETTWKPKMFVRLHKGIYIYIADSFGFNGYHSNSMLCIILFMYFVFLCGFTFYWKPWGIKEKRLLWFSLEKPNLLLELCHAKSMSKLYDCGHVQQIYNFPGTLCHYSAVDMLASFQKFKIKNMVRPGTLMKAKVQIF